MAEHTKPVAVDWAALDPFDTATATALVTASAAESCKDLSPPPAASPALHPPHFPPVSKQPGGSGPE